jgi:threonine dehydrogenase-like Zn-dependent dehydrogenase
MTLAIKKYYVVGPCQLELREETLPEPGPGEALIRTHVSALSVGTESWRYVNGGHYGGEGSTCGYNSAGVVAATGPGVIDVRPGDAVFTIQPHAELVLVEARQVIRLPGDLDLESAAFTYLPTLGLHALRSANYQAGENVLVIGLGIVGLLAAQVARMVGARLAALEVDPLRRAVAEQAGVAPVLDPRAPDAMGRLQTVFGSPGPDIIVETSQAWNGLLDAVRLAHPETRIAIVGIYRTKPTEEVARDLLRATFMNRDHFHNQHVRFIGCSNDPADDYPPSVVRWTIQRNMQYMAEQIAADLLAPARAITHRFRWDELQEVYDRLAGGIAAWLGSHFTGTDVARRCSNLLIRTARSVYTGSGDEPAGAQRFATAAGARVPSADAPLACLARPG